MSTIQTCLRIKPLGKGETLTNNMQVLQDPKRVILGPKAFDFDHLLSSSVTQRSVFEQTCHPVIDSVFDGVKGSIIVYGQTGSGKTHTMFGSSPNETDGIVYHSIKRMLDYSEVNQCVLSLSVLEVYMEKVTDLQSSKEVVVRKAFDPELVWTPITSVENAEKVITEALQSRHVTSTNINERSSRGHVMLSIKLLRPRRSVENDAHDDTLPIDESQLTLVDLAGSENVNRSKVQGRGMQEASSINRSLLALKKIILELSSASLPTHISYRDSKLTLLLQDSIGGYSRTLLIACVSSAARDIEETRSSLEYSTKARQIRNLIQSEKERLSAKVKTLEFETQKMKNKFDSLVAEKGNVFLSKAEYDELMQCKEENAQLTVELQRALKRISSQTNASQYLKVIQGITSEREKAHASDLETMRNQLMSHRQTIGDMARQHFENTMQALSVISSDLNSGELELRDGFQTFQDNLKNRAVELIVRACTECFEKTSDVLMKSLQHTGMRTHTKAQMLQSLGAAASSDESYETVINGLQQAIQFIHGLQSQQRSMSTEREDMIHFLKEITEDHKSIDPPAKLDAQPIRAAITNLQGSMEDVFFNALQNRPKPNMEAISSEVKDFLDQTTTTITMLGAGEEKTLRDSSSHRGSINQNRRSTMNDAPAKRISSSESSRGSTESDRPSDTDRNRPKKSKKASAN